MTSRTLIIRPTLGCNITCEYCYVDVKKGLMSHPTLDELGCQVERYLEAYPEDQVSCIWHGGEPSLMPMEFWEKVEAIFNRLDSKRIYKSMQSNLIRNDKKNTSG